MQSLPNRQACLASPFIFVHLSFYAPREDDVERVLPPLRKVNVRAWQNLVSLRAPRDARSAPTGRRILLRVAVYYGSKACPLLTCCLEPETVLSRKMLCRVHLHLKNGIQGFAGAC